MYYAKDYRAMARRSLKGHWPLSILVTFIALILGGLDGTSMVELNLEAGNTYLTLFGFNIGQNMGANPADMIGGVASGMFAPGFSSLFGFMGGIVSIYAIVIFIIGGAIVLGVRTYFIKLNYEMNPEVSDLFSHMRIFLKALGLQIMMLIFIFLWSLLFIIPGIVAFYRYSMATYIMAENPEIGVFEAISASKAMMAGRKWRLFCLEFSFIGWHILCAFTFGLGYLLLHPYIESARAHFYLTIKHNMTQ